jgi:hypothetical protein
VALCPHAARNEAPGFGVQSTRSWALLGPGCRLICHRWQGFYARLVETTAREAMVRDFRVLFLSDGTAASGMGGATAAELQKATLATLGTVFAQVLTVDEVIHKICGGQSPTAVF